MTPEQKAAAYDALMAILNAAPSPGEIVIRKYAPNWRAGLLTVGVREPHCAEHWMRGSSFNNDIALDEILISMHNELKDLKRT